MVGAIPRLRKVVVRTLTSPEPFNGYFEADDWVERLWLSVAFQELRISCFLFSSRFSLLRLRPCNFLVDTLILMTNLQASRQKFGLTISDNRF